MSKFIFHIFHFFFLIFHMFSHAVVLRVLKYMQLQSNHAIRTPHYYVRQFALSLGKENPFVFSTFNPLDTDTSLMRRLSMDPSGSVLHGVWLYSRSSTELTFKHWETEKGKLKNWRQHCLYHIRWMKYWRKEGRKKQTKVTGSNHMLKKRKKKDSFFYV